LVLDSGWSIDACTMARALFKSVLNCSPSLLEVLSMVEVLGL